MNDRPQTSVELWKRSAGRGEPVLLISGLGYSAWCWDELRDALAAGFRVVTFDNRGTGRSSKPPGPCSIPMLADDAASVLDTFGIARAHVIGHSMGGYIAQTLALNHPGKVRSLVLIGTSPGGPRTLPVPEETQTAWKGAAGLSPQDYARRTMPISFAPGWTDAHPATFERYLARRIEHPTPPECWLAQFQACADYVVDGVPVEQLRVPALVIHGDADRVVPFENGRQLGQRLPGARWHAVAGAGHIPYLEDPPGLASLIGRFLGSA
jgi:pimeloyl-ACP methyl ester carboxylesterase